MSNTDAAWAWVAGVLEGDGCFTINGHLPRVSMGMTDRDVLDRVMAITGVGKVSGPHFNEKGHNIKGMYYWNVSKKADVLLVIDNVMPWLGIRRRERAEVIREMAVNNYSNRDKTHCKHGHALSGDNLYVWRDRRSCRACRAATAREFERTRPYRSRAAS